MSYATLELEELDHPKCPSDCPASGKWGAGGLPEGHYWHVITTPGVKGGWLAHGTPNEQDRRAWEDRVHSEFLKTMQEAEEKRARQLNWARMRPSEEELHAAEWELTNALGLPFEVVDGRLVLVEEAFLKWWDKSRSSVMAAWQKTEMSNRR